MPLKTVVIQYLCSQYTSFKQMKDSDIMRICAKGGHNLKYLIWEIPNPFLAVQTNKVDTFGKDLSELVFPS